MQVYKEMLLKLSRQKEHAVWVQSKNKPEKAVYDISKNKYKETDKLSWAKQRKRRKISKHPSN